MQESTSALYAHLTELENRLEIETQRRAQAETSLRRLTKAAETMQLGVTITDVEGKIVYTNPADAIMHGYTVDELIGQDVSALGCPHDRNRLEAKALEGMKSWQRERLNTRKDGSVFPVELLSDAVIDTDGRPIGIITTCQDISSRKAAEQQLRDSHEELEARLRQSQKLEAIGQLTGGIAHDFNNMLAVVLANAELLVAYLPEDDDDLRVAASDIREAARASARMIERLLGFSRQAPLELIPTDLGQLVCDTTGMLRRIIRQDIEIEVATDTPAGTVTADHSAVQQMLMNLVTNARDAMSEGGAIRIVVANEILGEDEQKAHPWVQPGDYVRVSVSDTGTGMDADTLGRVFEPFFTTKPQGQGTGLGLAMIYGLMKQHRGYVHVFSEPGLGTTVHMHFPAIAAQAERPSIPISTAASFDPQSGTILLAEDEEIVRRTACRALERLGYRVLAAQDGADAIAIFHQHRNEIGLVMSDMIMPKMGGRELYAAIRREDPRIPFLFTSGYRPDDVRVRISLSEHTMVLQKPWKLDDLAAAVRRALDAVAQ